MRWLKRRQCAALTGLRGRIALMCLLAAAPLLALLIAGAAIERAQTLRAAEDRLLDLAALGTDRQRDIIAETATLLQLLATTPAVRDMVPPACDAVVATAAAGDPRVGRIMVVRPNGAIACISKPAATRPSLRDRTYFRRALAVAPGAPPVIGMISSRLTGLPTLVAALPLPAEPDAESPSGVILAALSMDWLARLDPYVTSAAVIDATDGSMLGRSGTADVAPVGGHADPLLLAAFARLPHGGTVAARDWNGRAMIFGFAPISVTGRPLMLAVGIARRAVLANVDRRLWMGATLALAAVLATVVLSRVAARSLLLRPIGELTLAANRLGAGDAATRAPTGTRVAELRALGLAFNRMAVRLQIRNHQLAATQATLAQSAAHHRLLADSVTDMITLFGPDFRRRYVSPASRDLLGFAPEELVGEQPGGIVHPDDWLLLDATLNAPMRAGQETARGTYRALRRDGRCIWLESSGRRLPDGSGYVVVTRDVSERKAFEEKLEAANRQLEELAALDPLTGLANRRRFTEVLGTEHRRARRLGLPLSIVVVDVDRFKLFNDRYGHPAGDACLQAVAGAIDSVLRRPGDLAARIGGEEFVVLLANTRAVGARLMAGRIRGAVRALALAHADSDAGIVTVSQGIASTEPGDDSDAATLMNIADQALYEAKRSGRDAVRSGRAASA